MVFQEPMGSPKIRCSTARFYLDLQQGVGVRTISRGLRPFREEIVGIISHREWRSGVIVKDERRAFGNVGKIDDQIGAAPNLGGVGDDLGAVLGILLVRDAAPLPCPGLDEHLVASTRQFFNADGDHGDAIFICFDFLGNADDVAIHEFCSLKEMGQSVIAEIWVGARRSRRARLV